ncbi:methyltransferase [Methylacidiphilum sp. Yel]|uniref:class I SAM-dependent methyltransferase n=1 Tax=Methylacidiphilum sp. Yel TaxID=1847730 RepID=UPI00106B5F03|nr:class I SAM-dependent methyltransferase [Methylacidiphilum sp. Yel]TFE67146.1 methyltransferase [Methylacidiphilum sp. Yel]
MRKTFSASSSASISFKEKVCELYNIFRLRLLEPKGIKKVERLLDDLEEYSNKLFLYAGKSIENARILEIGFGARPLRMALLKSFGAKIKGVDLDVPLLDGKISEVVKIWKKNGMERAIKSFIRFYLFDLAERKILSKATELRGKKLTFSFSKDDLFICDASELEFDSHSFDLIISEDVFEHIETNSLVKLIPKMAHWLDPSGVAFIRPNIYTGICGGHLTEWFPSVVNSDMKRRSEPWEHLRKRRFQPNTFLNRLSRKDYRSLFSQYFDILEEEVKHPDLGRKWLTAEIQEELKDYPYEELFSNTVLFVLKPKKIY